MAELSRMKKYEELRNKLQEVDENVSTKELSRFEKRLNQLDANNFSLNNQVLNDSHNPLHARSNESVSFTKDSDPNVILDKTQTYDDPFLDEYINEVKQYNLDQGNAISTNTNVNVLNSIRNDLNTNPKQKPYLSSYQKPIDFENSKDLSMQAERRDTTGLVNTERMNVIEDSNPFEDSQTMSKDDIMAEVQSLVNGEMKDSYAPMGTDTFQRHITNDNRNAQQQLLNETTQMRAQLDDYEDNLSEVNGKVSEVMRLSNIILTVFIFFLVIALICFIYLLILSRGV